MLMVHLYVVCVSLPFARKNIRTSLCFICFICYDDSLFLSNTYFSSLVVGFFFFLGAKVCWASHVVLCFMGIEEIPDYADNILLLVEIDCI